MPKYLLDTNILISLIKGEPTRGVILSRAESLEENDLSICAVTLYELEVGARRHGQRERLDKIIAAMEMPVLPFDAAVAREAARISQEVSRQQGGKVWPRSGVADLFIAATAKVHGLILVTNNEADFAAVAGLKVENWAKP